MTPKQSMWGETSVFVTKSFRLNKVLSHRVPSRITFTEDDKKMYFLAGSGRSCLYSVDFEQEVEDIDKPLEPTQFFDNAYVPISREEELLRERQRICKNGITTFEYCNKTLLVPLGCNLFYHDMTIAENQPSLIKESEQNMYYDTKLCPTDPRLISFIRNNDIYITSSLLQEYTAIRLTESSNPSELYNGVPSFVVQEEFDRYTGYYWRPIQDAPETYHVLYEQVDETGVPSVRLSAASEENQSYKFPLAGQSNAVASLKLVKFTLDTEAKTVGQITRYNLLEELQVTFPWVEYIPWFNWHPSGKSIWCMLLDRPQQKFSLITLPLEYFTKLTNGTSEENEVKPSSSITTLVSKTSQTWINVSEDIKFLPSEEGTFDFVFLHEDKHNHLYRVTCTGSTTTETQLTDGDWSVTSLLAVTPSTVYFHAQRNPIQQHLFKMELKTPGVVEQLTPEGFFHTCTLNNSLTEFASVYSNSYTHYQCSVFSLDTGDKLRTVTSTLNFGEVYLKKTGVVPEPQKEGGQITTYRYDTPIIDKIDLDGKDVYYVIYPAKGVDLTQPQPVLLYVYGGPAIQLVVDRFKGIHHRQQNLFATLGYSVVVADCPGSANRGKEWAEVLYKKMGSVEVDMQIKVLEALSQQHTYLDLSRVAVMGTSYGGYVALMALGQRPDFFKLSIAIAPAISWHLYDTAYSERYMGLLNENQDVYYGPSSVLHYVPNFPSEEHRLLIVHGLMDENVHFTHTTTLISEMISAGKPYDLQVYPEERHGIGRGNAPAHCDTTIAVYLNNHLKHRD
ncbi:dipeptidyl peptidase 8-like [Bolinopsis microptera]|uniref:dipeptidyl peptidase 8-like n=1 Tax=Bolinopsis microptera TaxID=2820187 RepID=UPI00307AF56D